MVKRLILIGRTVFYFGNEGVLYWILLGGHSFGFFALNGPVYAPILSFIAGVIAFSIILLLSVCMFGRLLAYILLILLEWVVNYAAVSFLFNGCKIRPYIFHKVALLMRRRKRVIGFRWVPILRTGAIGLTSSFAIISWCPFLKCSPNTLWNLIKFHLLNF